MAVFYPRSAEDSALIVAWIRQNIGTAVSLGPDARPIAVVRDGVIVAAVAYDNYRENNIEVSFCAVTPRWGSPDMVGLLLAYPFVQLSTRRVTAIIHPKNKGVRRFIEGIGFRHEGTLRDAFYPHAALIYGLLRRDYMAGPYYARVRALFEPAKVPDVPLGAIRPAEATA